MIYNECMSIQLIDLILIFFMITTLITAWRKGLLRQISDLICLIGSVFLCLYIVQNYPGLDSYALLVFIGIRVLLAFLQGMILPKKHGVFSLLDRIGAVFFALVRIYVIFALFFYIVSYLPIDGTWYNSSVVYPYFKEVDAYVRQKAGI
ncbi:hypothetical protein C815_01138 [Firmicutes bacterium M10-2]|nr:hypothetical protein C815_01138 [Firmicutes bacterium M10-2]